MLRSLRWGVPFLVLAGLSPMARASFIPPAGYGVQDLGISADGFGVSPTGELATETASGNTVTINLYNTWQTGRTLIGTATITTPVTIPPTAAFATDIAFQDNNNIYVGENHSTSTLYKVDFSTSSPTITSFPSGTFHGIQGIVIKGNQMLVSGTDSNTFEAGNFYLDLVNLTNNVTTPIAGGPGTGTGFVGGTAITGGGKGVLLDSGFDLSPSDAQAYLYDLTAGTRTAISLNDGGSATGAYGIAMDGADNAYITAGEEIERIASIDGTYSLTSFGEFSDPEDGPFPTGIAFTGGDFTADGGGDGALIVNGGFTSEGGLFAIVALPEPASLGLLATGGLLLLRRRRA